jgi:hypothetical protein
LARVDRRRLDGKSSSLVNSGSTPEMRPHRARSQPEAFNFRCCPAELHSRRASARHNLIYSESIYGGCGLGMDWETLISGNEFSF